MKGTKESRLLSGEKESERRVGEERRRRSRGRSPEQTHCIIDCVMKRIGMWEH